MRYNIDMNKMRLVTTIIAIIIAVNAVVWGFSVGLSKPSDHATVVPVSPAR